MAQTNTVIAAGQGLARLEVDGTATGTVSLSSKMAGFGSTWSLTPQSTGNFLILVDITALTLGGATSVQANWGTGTAPNQGDAGTGTQVGGTANLTSDNAIYGFITGAIVGTNMWVDIKTNGAMSAGSITGNVTMIEV